MIRGDLSVRGLAEFTCRQGDLYARKPGRAIDADEGIAVQKSLQEGRQTADPAYQREVSVGLVFTCGDSTRTLKGRMDGLFYEGGQPVIEEFKCCAILPEVADPLDVGQLFIYAGLFACNAQGVDHLNLRLVYVQVDNLAERVFSYRMSAARAQATVAFMLLCYATRIERHQRRCQARLTWAASREFPMPSFRPSQQAIARRVYRAISARENLLLEAPTGSGKTLGVLYPAIRAQQADDQLFFLTSRNAGALAAIAAADQIDPAHQHLSLVELNAKEKMCFVEGMPCDPQRCRYAAGYFDRVGAAVNELLDVKWADRAQIEATAQAHEVCPFELSLDVALWADVICGDYNYVFDPVVKLQRFSGHKSLHLLVDEAHQLSPRVREMLGVSLSRRQVRVAKSIAHPGIKKRVTAIDRTLLSMRREYGEGEHVIASVKSLLGACQRLLEWVAQEELELEQYPDLIDLYFAAARWVRSESWTSAEAFAHVLAAEGREIEVNRVCLDAAAYLSERFAEHGGVIRFSGTLTPLTLYQRLHGQTSDSWERAQSPFHEDQALVLVVPDVPTYFKQRQASLPKLLGVLREVMWAKPGRYLVALPSYAYLQTVAACAHADWGECFVQIPGQNAEETVALLDRFCHAEQGVLLIVMGGIYGESVDFTGAQLDGVIMVGLGLPPPSLARNLLESYFDNAQGGGWGRLVAYTQPALVKNIQAAGRLIRSEADFGVICLIDPRFTSAEVQRFFPSHWRPQVTGAAEVTAKVTQFWQHKFPQLKSQQPKSQQPKSQQPKSQQPEGITGSK